MQRQISSRYNHRTGERYDEGTGVPFKDIYNSVGYVRSIQEQKNVTGTGNDIQLDDAYTEFKNTRVFLNQREGSPNSAFRLVFTCTSVFTLITLLLGFALIIIEFYSSSTNSNLKSYINGILDFTKIGFGAIVGLLGSKVTSEK